MVCQWEPWVQYDCNSVVEFEGHRYKIVQPHQSQPDWTPSIVPALWSRVPQESHNDCQSGGQQNYQNQGFVDQSGGGNYGQQNNPQGGTGGGYGQEQHQQSGYNNQQSEHKEESWLDDSKKHKLEIGGGILGALAIGYAGKEHNDFDKYEVLCGDKNAVKWVNHAANHGVIQAQGWQPVEGGREEDGRFLFVSQVLHEGGVHPCKAQDGTDFAIFSYGGKEKTSQEFNILTYA